MCSSNCMREFQKFWTNSMQALFLAASGQTPTPDTLSTVTTASVSQSLQNYANYTHLYQTPYPPLTGLKTTHRRRRRRKRNRNKRLFLQKNSNFANNDCNTNTNVEMRVKSIVRYWMIYTSFASDSFDSRICLKFLGRFVEFQHSIHLSHSTPYRCICTAVCIWIDD